jgi:MoaA/NifB/PqqE/SkfB family radical SAM enzyme
MLKTNLNPKIRIQSFCGLPFQRMKINHIGDVAQCCFQSQPIGNILNDTFDKVWGSDLAKEIQETTLKGELHPVCKGWGGCPFIGESLEKTETSDVYENFNFPTGLELELPPYHCNIGGTDPNEDNPACIMCPRNSKEYVNGPNFKVNKFDEILSKVKMLMPFLDELTILGVAEPFWKDALFDSLETLNFGKHREKIHFWTFTNGSIFSKKIEEKYCEIVKDSCLNFSIDAATPETYLKIRRLNFYDTIKRNITRYANNSPESHVISICHNINIHNLHEMPLMVKDAIEMGADSIYMNPVHSAGGYINVEKLQVTDRGLFNDLRSQAIELAHGKIEISIIRDLPDPVLVELS